MKLFINLHKFAGFYISKPTGTDPRDFILTIGWISIYFDIDGKSDY